MEDSGNLKLASSSEAPQRGQLYSQRWSAAAPPKQQHGTGDDSNPSVHGPGVLDDPVQGIVRAISTAIHDHIYGEGGHAVLEIVPDTAPP